MTKVFLLGDPEKRKNYIAALESCGALATVSTSPEASACCDALLLPGGADMDPTLYGAENLGSIGIDRELDQKEIALARAFCAANKPILGICRGMQVLNVAFGGTLIQDLPTAAVHRWEESTGDKAHMVTAAEGGFAYQIYGERFSVNSAHHQGADRIAAHFKVAAQADDGVVEAIEWPERKIYGVQWHPERLMLEHQRPDAVDGHGVFEFFLARI